MGVSLTKGQSIDLKKAAPSLSKLTAGAGWDPTNEGADIDLDLLVVLQGADGQAIPDANGNGTNLDEAVVFFNNLKVAGVEHHGDNLTGQGDGDDEQVSFTLADVPANVAKATVVVASYSGQTFGEVKNAFVRLVNDADGTELAKFELAENFGSTKGISLGELTRNGDGWDFKATGTPIDGEFNQIVASFGVSGI